MIIIFDYDAGVFDDESLAIRPATPSPKVVVQIPNVKKNISAKLNFKILVGNRGSSNVFHVFEEIFMLPKFSMFYLLKTTLKDRATGCVKFKKPSRMQQV